MNIIGISPHLLIHKFTAESRLLSGKESRTLHLWRPVWRPFRSASQPWSESILFGQAGLIKAEEHRRPAFEVKPPVLATFGDVLLLP
jgi:hypothetical protein